MTALAPMTDRPLTAPFDTPPSGDALRPSAATMALVNGQVKALLDSTPSYHQLAAEEKTQIAKDVTKIAAYAAECVREICWQSDKLGQVPMARERRAIRAPLAQAQEFQPAAVNQVARVTQETLRAIAFPTFVSDLISGTFRAITETNIRQMEAFGAMVSNVSGTVDQFMGANISDNQARDWIASRYPEHVRVQNGRLSVRDGAEEREAPNFRSDLNLNEDVSLDESALEETLVPAARRRLAETRLQMLSTLVLMGVNRIVITGGKIRATMAFHIDTTDRSHEEHATDLDFRVQAAAQFGFAAWSASVSTSLTYVSSTRTTNDSEINTQTDLTGEVELHFKTDYFPLNRFATPGQVGRIQGNTAAPEGNAPSAEAGGPFETPPAAGNTITPVAPRRREPQAPSYRPIGTPPPEPRMPDRPTAPEPVQRRPPQQEQQPDQTTTPAPATTTPAPATTTPTTTTPEAPATTTPAPATTTPEPTPAPQPAAAAAAMSRR